jgi:hypothetical protein
MGKISTYISSLSNIKMGKAIFLFLGPKSPHQSSFSSYSPACPPPSHTGQPSMASCPAQSSSIPLAQHCRRLETHSAPKPSDSRELPAPPPLARCTTRTPAPSHPRLTCSAPRFTPRVPPRARTPRMDGATSSPRASCYKYQAATLCFSKALPPLCSLPPHKP